MNKIEGEESFLIIDKDKNKNRINYKDPFINESTEVESIYLPLSKQTKPVPYKDKSKIVHEKKRSGSLSRISSFSFEKKKDECFIGNNIIINMDFEILEDN